MPESTAPRVTPRRIGVGTSSITDADEARLLAVLRSGRLSPGAVTSDFEARFAALHDRRHAAMCNSGTGALQLALQALKDRDGWPDGAEVIVPAMTFVATVNTVLYNDLTPVLVDIDPVTFNMDPAACAAAVTDRTVAIVPVHLFGQPANMTDIMAIARKHDLLVVEDSCETLGVRHAGQMVGSFGDYACFSTYMAHLVTTGVGGLALTDDNELATRFRSLMNHGRNPRYLRIDDDQGLSDEDLLKVIESRYEFVWLGQSYRATEMEAALGIGQLERLGEAMAARREIGAALGRALAHPDLQLPEVAPGNEHAWMMYAIVCRRPGLRNPLVLALERAGVETRFLLPILGQPCYEGVLSHRPGEFPVTEHAQAHGFYIGCHPGMTADDVAYIGEVARTVVGTAS